MDTSDRLIEMPLLYILNDILLKAIWKDKEVANNFVNGSMTIRTMREIQEAKGKFDNSRKITSFGPQYAQEDEWEL